MLNITGGTCFQNALTTSFQFSVGNDDFRKEIQAFSDSVKEFKHCNAGINFTEFVAAVLASSGKHTSLFKHPDEVLRLVIDHVITNAPHARLYAEYALLIEERAKRELAFNKGDKSGRDLQQYIADEQAQYAFEASINAFEIKLIYANFVFDYYRSGQDVVALFNNPPSQYEPVLKEVTERIQAAARNPQKLENIIGILTQE